MMTRKDYIALAQAVHRANVAVDDQGWDERIHANCIADALAEDNPRFNREYFLAACGVN